MMLKRTLDTLAALLLIVLTSPIWLVVGFLVWRHDRGPVLFRQQRVGLGGRLFGIYKFRSMVVNADKIGAYATADADPRITPIGRVIRRWSLDELPQLINVLVGDMSMVGPRPDVPAQRDLYTDEEFALRHAVRPGITGLAQARLRSAASADERKALDLEYARNSSLALDIKIALLTVRQILVKGGN